MTPKTMAILVIKVIIVMAVPVTTPPLATNMVVMPKAAAVAATIASVAEEM